MSRARPEHIPQDRTSGRRFGLLGQPWTLELMLAMHQRHHARFGDLVADLAGISRPVLSQRLKDLVHAGLLDKHVTATPLSTWYQITPTGRRIAGAVQTLDQALDDSLT